MVPGEDWAAIERGMMRDLEDLSNQMKIRKERGDSALDGTERVIIVEEYPELVTKVPSSGERKSKRYDALRDRSIGLGITSTVQHHARRLCDLQREEHSIEVELQQLLNDSKFTAYREVFRSFGFGLRLEAIILSQIYPLEAYFGADGKPEVRIRKGRKSGKPTKRYLSLRRFQKSLGLAPSMEASGDKSKIKIQFGGSDLCRIAFWQWVFTRIEVKRYRLDNEIGSALGAQLDAEKAAGRPVRLVRSRVSVKAAKLLFRELVKALE